MIQKELSLLADFSACRFEAVPVESEESERVTQERCMVIAENALGQGSRASPIWPFLFLISDF